MLYIDLSTYCETMIYLQRSLEMLWYLLGMASFVKIKNPCIFLLVI